MCSSPNCCRILKDFYSWCAITLSTTTWTDSSYPCKRFNWSYNLFVCVENIAVHSVSIINYRRVSHRDVSHYVFIFPLKIKSLFWYASTTSYWIQICQCKLSVICFTNNLSIITGQSRIVACKHLFWRLSRRDKWLLMLDKPRSM